MGSLDQPTASSRSRVKSAARSPSATVAPVSRAIGRAVGRSARTWRPCGRARRRSTAASATPRCSRWRRTPGPAERRWSRRSPPQRPGGTIRVTVPLDPRQLGGERVAPGRRRGERRLVGVQPDAHVDLRRVVPLERSKSSRTVTECTGGHDTDSVATREPRFGLRSPPDCGHERPRCRNPTVIAEHVERYRQQLAEVGPLQIPVGREDLRAAVREAEQGLRNAERLLRRALKLIS